MALESSAADDKFTDHSSCCEQRGVSPVCLSLCKGNVKRIGENIKLLIILLINLN